MAQEKYLNPFTDFGFKKLFGSEPNKDLLIDFPREEMAAYENSLKHYRDVRNVIDTAELKGETKGRAEGRVEGKAEVAQTMLAKGYPINVIVELTGLTEVDIAALSKPQTKV